MKLQFHHYETTMVSKTALFLHSSVNTPRNRDNFIRVGNTYELFYNRNLEWISAGTLTADCDSVLFEVPRGSLLYLKNHTQGKDERIFEYLDGRQKFW